MGDVSEAGDCEADQVNRELFREVAKSVVILTVAWAAYSMVRLLTTGSADVARANAVAVDSLQATLGIGIEAAIQDLMLGEVVGTLANSYYLLHFPVTLLLLVAMFVRHRTTIFPVVRDGLVAMTFFGLIVHLAFPLAPPRMLDGIVDASTMYGPNPYTIPGSGAANQFAAMPSMHVAWAIVAGWALWRSTTTRFGKVAGLLHPAFTVAVVVVTGHHFMLDAIVGSVFAVVALAGASLFHRSRRRAVDNMPVVHSSSTGERARNRAFSPSYPLVSHSQVLAPLTVCQRHPKNRSPASRTRPAVPLSHPIVTMRTCSSHQ